MHKSSFFSSQPSAAARLLSRNTISTTINSDLERISDWGSNNLVRFNSAKTHLLPISLSNDPSDFDVIFEGNIVNPLHSINILGVEISSNLSWRSHIVQIAKSASKKLGVLFRCKNFFTSAQLLQLYTGLIRPRLEYCSHIWGASSSTSLLDRVESKAFCLIDYPDLTLNLDSLALRRKVASLSLFYRYYHGRCSSELAACVPPPLGRPRATRQANTSHERSVALTNPRIGRYGDCFFPSVSRLWNSLPSTVFPDVYNLSLFKKQVCHHLRE